MPQTIINLTPHDVTFFVGEYKVSFPSFGSVRLNEKEKETGKVGPFSWAIIGFEGISVVLSEKPVIEGTPVVIVSLPVLMALKDTQLKAKFLKILKEKGIENPVIVAPDTGNDSVVRDENGRILGVKRFRKLN